MSLFLDLISCWYNWGGDNVNLTIQITRSFRKVEKKKAWWGNQKAWRAPTKLCLPATNNPCNLDIKWIKENWPVHIWAIFFSEFLNQYFSCFHGPSDVNRSGYKLLPGRKRICPAVHPPKHFSRVMLSFPLESSCLSAESLCFLAGKARTRLIPYTNHLGSKQDRVSRRRTISDLAQKRKHKGVKVASIMVFLLPLQNWIKRTSSSLALFCKY